MKMTDDDGDGDDDCTGVMVIMIVSTLILIHNSANTITLIVVRYNTTFIHFISD